MYINTQVKQKCSCSPQLRWERWYLEHRTMVFSIAHSRLGNFQDAEDLTQEIFLEVHTCLEGKACPRNPRAWLRILTLRRCVDRIRRRRPVSEAMPVEQVEFSRAGEGEERGAVLNKLEPILKETAKLFYLEGLRIKEIATRLNVPLGTVKRRLHVARARVRQRKGN